MAESTVRINEGTGKYLHTYQRTISALNVEDEVMLVGDQYLATYVANTTAVSAATANSHILELMAGASLRVQVRRIIVYQHLVATTAAFCRFLIYRLTSAGTGGTVVGVPSLDPADGAAGATAMSLPTVKGTEGSAVWSGVGQFIQTIPVGGPGTSAVLLDLDFDRLRTKPLVIAAGAANGIAIKNIEAIAAAQVAVSIYFTEGNTF